MIRAAAPQPETTSATTAKSAHVPQSWSAKPAAISAFTPTPIRLQPKLTVNTPGDKYEQEADRVAEQVMRMPDPQVQRQCSCGGSVKSGECPECKKKKQEEKGKLQRVANTQGGGITAPPIVNDVLNSSGSPLPAGTRSFMESRFGHDFSHVRVHNDSQAQTSAQAVSARAYTVGNHIAFGQEQFQPGSLSGQRLLAHELTHVVQQSKGIQTSSDSTGLQRQANGSEQIGNSSAQEPVPDSTSKCASNLPCAQPDKVIVPSNSERNFSITAYATTEGPLVSMPLCAVSTFCPTGHAWINLTDSHRGSWTFGFWPRTFFQEKAIAVPGCVRHPDHVHDHEITAEKKFSLTESQFENALTTAISACESPPEYTLLETNCSSFVRDVLVSSGVGPVKFGLIWESPNAVAAYLGGKAVTIGVRVPLTTGSVAITSEYSLRLGSALRNRVRLESYARGDFETRPVSAGIAGGARLELTTDKVWLPSVYVFGEFGGRLGESNSINVASGVGASFAVDEIFMVGIERRIVKNVVGEDGDLTQTSATLGIRW